jgi:uncharacterized protein YdhG (YjbR/CyaY superfamily)
MAKTAKTVEEYLANVPPKERAVLKRLRKQIKEAAPQAEETIGYQMPYYKQKGIVVSFAAFKDHCSLFAPGAARKFKAELAPYKTAKATIQFTAEKPLPAGLVKKLVKARIAENEARDRSV